MGGGGGEWSASYNGKEDPISTDKRLDDPQGPCGEERNPLFQPGTELSFLDYQTCSLVSIQIQVYWLS
jgi:hypothetical protein